MARQICIYGPIREWLATDVIQQIAQAAEDNQGITVRINTEGGDPQYGWGMAAAFNEFEGDKTVCVDAKAYSAGTYFVCYADKVIAYDVSEFLIHRAAYSAWFESNPEYFTEDLRANLERINKSLRQALEAKIDVAKFEKMKGVKMKDIFSLDARIDVYLTAKEAKQIGLVSEVRSISAEQVAAQQTMFETYNQGSDAVRSAAEAAAKAGANPGTNPVQTKIVNKMTLAEFKTQHPAIYAEAVAVGVAEERDRVGAWLVHNETDPKAVAEGINSGDPISMTAAQELMVKSFAKTQKDALGAEGAPAVQTEKPPKEGEQTEAEKLGAQLDAKLGLNKEEDAK